MKSAPGPMRSKGRLKSTSTISLPWMDSSFGIGLRAPELEGIPMLWADEVLTLWQRLTVSVRAIHACLLSKGVGGRTFTKTVFSGGSPVVLK